MKLFTDFYTLSKRKQVAVGIVNAIIGGALMIGIDLSIGQTMNQAIFELSLTVVVSVLFMMIFAIIVRLRAMKITR